MILAIQAATSLQLAAWAMAQLQSSVHTLYRCQLWISSLAKTTINTKTRTRTRTNTNTKKQRQPSMHPLLSGVCEEGKTSSADILASLARALEGYVPMLAMLRWSRILCKVIKWFLSIHFRLLANVHFCLSIHALLSRRFTYPTFGVFLCSHF